jgi:hypothetical protein
MPPGLLILIRLELRGEVGNLPLPHTVIGGYLVERHVGM